MAWDQKNLMELFKQVLKYEHSKNCMHNMDSSYMQPEEIMNHLECLLSTNEQNAFQYLLDENRMLIQQHKINRDIKNYLKLIKKD